MSDRPIDRKEAGFTLIEVTIILLVLVGLSTILLPQIGGYNRLARFNKAKEDTAAICASMKKLLDDVMLGAFYGNPRERSLPLGLLIGPGATPQDGIVAQSNWQQPVFASFEENTDADRVPVRFVVDTFGDHLLQNHPLGDHGSGARYKNQLEDGRAKGVGAFFGWRGPYFDAFTPDPWGNRYQANVFALYRPADLGEADLFSSAVVCYSSGPDLGVDTEFNQPFNDVDGDGVFGWVTGGDDLTVVLSAAGPF